MNISKSDLPPEFESALSQLAPPLDEEALGGIRQLVSRPDTRLLAATQDGVLFRLQIVVREEYPENRLLYLGTVFEIRRLGMFTNEFSLVDFPSSLEARRQQVQEIFSALLVREDRELGWFSPASWEQLNDAQKAM